MQLVLWAVLSHETHSDSSYESELFENHFSALFLKSHPLILSLHVCAKNAYKAIHPYTLITLHAPNAFSAVVGPFSRNTTLGFFNSLIYAYQNIINCIPELTPCSNSQHTYSLISDIAFA
jgi:hypothetical protein